MRWERFPEVFHAIPVIAIVALGFFATWVLYFRGTLLPGSTLRDRQIFRAFRLARPWLSIDAVDQ